MSDLFDRISAKISKKCWVILVKDNQGRLNLLADPGLNRPWCANGPNPLRNQKTAEFHATNCGGMAATWEDAFRLLRNENPAFEKDLIEKANAAQIAQGQFNLPKGGHVKPAGDEGLVEKPSDKIISLGSELPPTPSIIVDQHGRPSTNGNN